MCPHGISVEKYCPACARKFAPDDESLTCAADNAVLLPITRDPLLYKVIEGKIEVIELIGAGGSSMVYRAQQLDLKRTVAFKLLRTDLVASAEKIERFGQEARMASRVHHRNVCTVYDFGILESGQPYLVLEMVEGRSLAKILKDEGVLPVSRALFLLKQITDGLKEAHNLSIMHRDLKPSNIMVHGTGDNESVKIIDFGLAKSFELDLEEQVASSGYMVGTPSYMSPEQVLGQQLDARTDIYSLGCVLYEMLTGRKAVDGKTAFDIMSSHLKDMPQPLDERIIPLDVQEFTFKCLSKDPDNRYQSFQEISDVLCALDSDTKSTRNAIKVISRRMRGSLPYLMGILAVAAIVGTAWHFVRTSPQSIPFFTSGTVSGDSIDRLMQQFQKFESRNETDQAEVVGKQAFDSLKRQGKQNTQQMLDVARGMERIYKRNGSTKEAAKYTIAVLEARRELARENIDKMIDAYREAGQSLLYSGQERDALPYLQQWFKFTEQKFGTDSKESTKPLFFVCKCEFKIGEYKAADQDFRRLGLLMDRYFAANDEFRLEVLLEWLALYVQIENFKEANEIADGVIKLSNAGKITSTNQLRTFATILDLAARAAGNSHDYNKAVTLTDKAVTTTEKWNRVRADLAPADRLRVQKGRFLREAKRYKEAEAVLKLELQRIGLHNADGPLYKWALDEYTKVLRETGRVAQADAVKQAGKL
jgi:serine/threonine protein kinase